jgi:hypothetical protein
MQIPAGGRVLAEVLYDGSKEPDFVGSLQIEANLLDDKGQKVGVIQIPIEVIRPKTPEKANAE